MQSTSHRFIVYPPGEISAGNLCLNYDTRVVSIGERKVPITSQEFDLLAVLIAQPDEIVSHAKLCQTMWGSFGRAECKRLTVIISQLRRKLAGSAPYDIEVVRARGYGLLRNPALAGRVG